MFILVFDTSLYILMVCDVFMHRYLTMNLGHLASLTHHIFTIFFVVRELKIPSSKYFEIFIALLLITVALYCTVEYKTYLSY